MSRNESSDELSDLSIMKSNTNHNNSYVSFCKVESRNQHNINEESRPAAISGMTCGYSVKVGQQENLTPLSSIMTLLTPNSFVRSTCLPNCTSVTNFNQNFYTSNSQVMGILCNSKDSKEERESHEQEFENEEEDDDDDEEEEEVMDFESLSWTSNLKEQLQAGCLADSGSFDLMSIGGMSANRRWSYWGSSESEKVVSFYPNRPPTSFTLQSNDLFSQPYHRVSNLYY